MPREIESKTILNKTRRRDPWFLDDYTINPFSACSFNCLFCYIRGSKYGQHMEQSLSVKVNAPELLRKQLSNRAKKGQFGIIVLSSATDPYLRIEEKYRLTRQILEIILEHRFPVHIITRSALVTRDLDLLTAIDQEAILPPELENKLPGGAMISFSFSTLDNHVAGIFEPGATPPRERLETVQMVKSAGLTTGISLMPLLPYISDRAEHLVEYFETFSQLRVDYLLPATLTLFGEGRADSKTLVMNAIRKHFPHLEKKYEQFFSKYYGVPAGYQQAFRRKMAELSQQYGIPQQILKG